jgi:hypothetical protein
MAQAEEQLPPVPEEPWRVILRLRWLLGGVIALAFALGRLIETVLLQTSLALPWLALDVTAWGLLGGLAVWLSLTWVSRQERGYRSEVERALQAQQNLNRRLQRANLHLSLLSEVNRRVASSASLDEILDSALIFPQRLFPARAAALLLCDASGPVTTRLEGAADAELAALREQLATAQAAQLFAKPQQLSIDEAAAPYAACLVVPLRDQQALIGWLEFYLPQPLTLASEPSPTRSPKRSWGRGDARAKSARSISSNAPSPRSVRASRATFTTAWRKAWPSAACVSRSG